MMNTMSDNPISFEYKKRYNMQPQAVRDQLDNFRKSDYQLKVIEKTRKPVINTGDVFLLSPRDNVYFYGKVLKTNINTINNDGFVHGKQTVFIHKCKTYKKTIDNYNPNYGDLLIPPIIVDISYWKKGFFFTIGNIPLNETEKTLKYGFYKLGIPGIRDGWFCTEEGKKLDSQPPILGMYGIVTITGVAAEIEPEIIMDPSLISD